MNELTRILDAYRSGALDLDRAVEDVRACFFEKAGDSTTLDFDRERRTGIGEVIYGGHKSPQQMLDAFTGLAAHGGNVLATRVSSEAAEAVRAKLPDARYHGDAQILVLKRKARPSVDTSIAVVTAGTSDRRVAEEAALTCEFFDNPVLRISDVGVAGIHRLLARVEDIRAARVVIVVAGMEGALPSVVGGLVDKPVIAVPTSVGYGANFGGLSALLGMLNSCAAGVSVVNIDNGFGAAVLANRINHL